MNRGVRRRAKGLEHEQDFVLLNQLAHHFNGLGRAVTVVNRDHVDLAAIDAALLVDHFEVGRFDSTDGAVGRRGARIRHRVTNLDFCIGSTGVVFFLRKRARRQGTYDQGARNTQQQSLHVCLLNG